MTGRRRSWTRLALALAFLAGGAGASPGAAPPAAVLQKLAGGAFVDFTAGRVGAPGGAAANLRAPNPDVARVGAERAARERARAALGKAVRALPLAGEGTVGARVEADPAASARLDAVLARAGTLEVSYAADGGTRVMLVAPLEAVRGALDPPVGPVVDAAAPTALVVDARKTAVRPALGVRVAAAGGLARALPTVWLTDLAAASADVRLGARPRPVLARGYDQGTLTLDLDGAELETAALAGALIVVVVNEGARK